MDSTHTEPETENTLFLMKLGKYFETIRLFPSYVEAMDFVSDLLRNKTQVHHKYSGYTDGNDFLLYEVVIGKNQAPQAVKRKVLNAELESRGFVKDRWKGWK